jgi:uracil-DNA glycosylase family 4
MPLPGPDLVRYVEKNGQVFKAKKTKDKVTKKQTVKIECGPVIEEAVRGILYQPGYQFQVTTAPGATAVVTTVPGHIWGEHRKKYIAGKADSPPVTGPRQARVMVVGKMLGREEHTELRNFVGPTGEVLIGVLKKLKVKGTRSWYVTNLVKFKPPEGMDVRPAWVADGKFLLHQELRLVQPDYILCLGADASKALLGPKATVSHMDGRVAELTYDTGFDGTRLEKKTALVMTVIHPVQVTREQSQARVLERGVARFGQLITGVRWDLAETGLDHRVVSDLDTLEALLWEIDNDPEKTDKVIACDAEWHGQHPCNKGSYLRTFQFAWKPKHAACVTLRGRGGVDGFFDRDGNPCPDRAIELLRDWFADKRVVGHFFNADLEWLVDAGLDLRGQFATPRFDTDDGVIAWERTRHEGGADTGLMAHAIEESTSYGLEVLTTRYTDAPRYDLPMQKWCIEQKEQFKVLEGYGEAPDELLLPYSLYDADVTLRLFYELDPLLDYDYEGNCCRESFWESMLAAPAVLEIHRNGILVDKERVDALSVAFVEARDGLEKRLCSWADWPAFNIRSVHDVRELLFGEAFSGKLDAGGNPVRKRPEGAKSLGITPYVDTSKPPKLWADLEDTDSTAGHAPGTGKAVLSVLAQENPESAVQINWLRDYRFIDQVLKSVLRPPKSDPEGVQLRDEDGLIYDAGLAAVLCDDGKVRTHIYQTKETGRWSSARPPLQNISKSRDPDYYRILKESYEYPLRSILMASPGHVFVEADYSGAELLGAAVMAGDATMMDHARRALLPDSGYDADGNVCEGGKHPHPDYYDIHSNIAVIAMRLDCAPTKAGLKSIGKVHFRTLAKRVIFGMMYGQGAKGSAMLAKEEGVDVSVAEAQVVIDTVFATYPGLVPFFEECRTRAIEDGWLCHCYGRYRRFPESQNSKDIGEYERQAMNFPIQGMIASAVSRAIAHLYHYRYDVGRPDLYRILLQIHDAILLEVPYEHVGFVAGTVIPYAMRDMVPIYPTTLAGVPTGKGPYYLGFGLEVSEHWGEPISLARCRELGIPDEYAGH